MTLEWRQTPFSTVVEAMIGDYAAGDGVCFTLEYRRTCYRRGPWRLLVEVASGPGHTKWGCFDEQDQPMRYYHNEECARREAQSIADVLASDRELIDDTAIRRAIRDRRPA